MAQSRRDDAFTRAEGDPHFLSAVRSAHTGRWDVLDALWWRSHPDETSPRGTASPSARLRDAQRRVFSAGGDSAGDEAVTDAMRALEAEIVAEGAAIDQAIGVAEAELASSRAAIPAGNAGPALVEPSPDLPQQLPPQPDGMGAADGDAGGGSSVVSPTAGQRRLLIGGVAAALVVGLVVGTQLGNGTTDAAAPAPTTSSTPIPPPPSALAVFDRPQLPVDLPELPVPVPPLQEGFDLASFRILGGVSQTSDIPAAVTAYAAKNTFGLVCLVLVSTDFEYMSTCTVATADDFPVAGLRLYWVSQAESKTLLHDESGTLEGAATSLPVDNYIVWLPEGSLQAGSFDRTTREP